jgi:hypothetical protein
MPILAALQRKIEVAQLSGPCSQSMAQFSIRGACGFVLVGLSDTCFSVLDWE